MQIEAKAAEVTWNLNNSGTYTATDGNTYYISGTISGNNPANITVADGATVTLVFQGDSTIDKTGATGTNARAPIALGLNSTVVVRVESGVTVTLRGSHATAGTGGRNGAFAPDGTTIAPAYDDVTNRELGTTNKIDEYHYPSYGGAGGFAGIHVPSTASLVLQGDGTLSAYGGNAGDGGTGVQGNLFASGAGGGGAGAGIGGNGAKGGDGALYNGPGGNGYNAGTAGYIYVQMTHVNAYGGYGGDGGDAPKQDGSMGWSNVNDGGGGGGYPGAGIGGGGAGGGAGGSVNGGGGFSGGGGGEGTQFTGAKGGKNGQGGETGYTYKDKTTGEMVRTTSAGSGGGGYLSAGARGGDKDGMTQYDAFGGYQYGGGGGYGAPNSPQNRYWGGNGGYGGTVKAIYVASGFAGTVKNGGAKSGAVVNSRDQATQGYGGGYGYTEGKVNVLEFAVTDWDFIAPVIPDAPEKPDYSGAEDKTPTGSATTTREYVLTSGTYSIDAGYYANVSYIVEHNEKATLVIDGIVTIDNTEYSASPIRVLAGGELDLVVDGTLRVLGARATQGANATAEIANGAGGNGGMPGIYVPVGGGGYPDAILNISGSGEVYAYGGDAGDGGNALRSTYDNSYYTGGGGGAGAGIGGDGGAGGTGRNHGEAGKSGTGAGIIRVRSDEVRVYAYGGGGGSGGNGGLDGGGGGGYPAAGIGGGGAGGGSGDDGHAGGGGFSSGSTDNITTAGKAMIGGVNGESSIGQGYGWQSGSYFNVNMTTPAGDATPGMNGKIGGYSGYSAYVANGGTAGAGGTLYYSDNVHAYNGSYYTEASSGYLYFNATTGVHSNEWGKYPTPIYAQLGFDLNKMRAAGITRVTGRTADAITAELSGKNVGGIETTGFGPGVGSGAGAVEASNGKAIHIDHYADISHGDVTITGNGNYYVIGSTTEYSITVDPSATGMILLDGVTIDMSGVAGKNAIDVKPGANVKIQTVSASVLRGAHATETTPGMAGIHVPVGATAEFYGRGTLYGGNGSNGGDATATSGGAGGHGSGAAMGGNGGLGGKGGTIGVTDDMHGQDGESAGTLIHGGGYEAHPGNGGTGGNSTQSYNGGPVYGGGGGGYPATSFGGGGAGGGGANENGGQGYGGGAGAGGNGGAVRQNGTSGTNFLGGLGYNDLSGSPVLAGKGGAGGAAPNIVWKSGTGDAAHEAHGWIYSHYAGGEGNGAGATEDFSPSTVVSATPAHMTTAPAQIMVMPQEAPGSVTISFSSVSGVDGYRILGSNKVWRSYTNAQLASSLSDGMYTVTLTDLLPDTDYQFSVHSYGNSGGFSVGTVSETVCTNGTVKPTGTVTAEAYDAQSMDVYWPVMSGVSSYKLTLVPLGLANEDGSGNVTDVPPEGAETMDTGTIVPTVVTSGAHRGEMTYRVTGLHPGVVYRVELRAVSGESTGLAKAEARAATPWVAKAPEVTIAPTEKSSDSAADSMSVTFTRPENWERIERIFEYRVVRKVVDERGIEVIPENPLEANRSFRGSGTNYPGLIWNGDTQSFTYIDTSVEQGVDAQNGHTYTYTVYAVNNDGNGEEGADSFTYAPRAPQNVTVLPFDEAHVDRTTNQLTVTWQTPRDNQNETLLEYEVYRVSAAGKDPVKVATVPHVDGTSDYSAVDLGTDLTGGHLAPGTTYYYIVRAKNANGLGLDSEIASGETNAVATSVREVTSKATGETSGTVTWKAPSSSRNTILGYKVLMYNAADNAVAGNWTLPVDASGIPTLELLQYDAETGVYIFNITSGLKSGNTYDVHIRAYSDAGDGVDFNLSLRPWAPPSAPTNVQTEKDTDNGTIRVTWNLPLDDGKGTDGAAITRYRVTAYKLINGVPESSTPNITTSTVGPERYITLTQVEAGYEYMVYVSAYNGVDYGPAGSAEAMSAMVADAPKDLKVQTLDDTSMYVSWGDADSRGSTIVQYLVNVRLTTNTGAAGITLTESIASNTTVNGKRVLQYEVGYDPETQQSKYITVTFDSFNAFGENLAHSAIIEGLTPGTQYIIEAYAKCQFNDGDRNDGVAAKSNRVRTMNIPDVVSFLTAEPKNQSGVITVNWGTSKDDWDSAVTKYVLYVYHGDFTAPNAELPADDDTRTIYRKVYSAAELTELKDEFGRLIDGEVYTVSVHALNGISEQRGTEEGKRTLISVVPRRPAASPTDFTLTLTGGRGTSGSVSWTDPTDLGGDELKGYIVTITDAEGAVLKEIKTDAEGTVLEESGDGPTMKMMPPAVSGKTSVAINEMTLGTDYVIFAKVYTGAGNGSDSRKIAFKSWSLPDAPLNLSAEPTKQDAGIRVSWEYPRRDGDGGIVGSAGDQTHTSVDEYRIEWKKATDGESAWTSKSYSEFVAEGNGGIGKDGRFYVVINYLRDGDEYQVRAYSRNGVGWTPGSLPASTSVTPCSRPQAPVIDVVYTGNESARISYIHHPEDNGDVLGDGGAAITAYKLYAVEAAQNAEGTWVPLGEYRYVHTAAVPEGGNGDLEDVQVPLLANGQHYLIVACAVNEACSGNDMDTNGNPSDPQHVFVGLPEAPTNVSVNPGMGNLYVCSYDAADGNGSLIEYYYIYVAPANDSGKRTGEFKPYTTTVVNGLPQQGKDPVQFKDLSNVLYGTISGNVLVRVTAWNQYGESLPSEEVHIKVGTPGAPEIQSVTVAKDSVDLVWSSVSDGGMALTGYNIYLREVEDPRNMVTITGVSGTAVPGDDTLRTTTVQRVTDGFTLTPGKHYTVQISAVNLGGEGRKSKAVEFAFGVPKAPTDVVVESGVGMLTVSFKPDADTGAEDTSGNPVALTQFKVYANGTLRGTVPANGSAEYTTTIDGLANGSAYNIQVSAVSVHGEGARSEGVSGTPATVPNQPTNITAVPESANTMRLTWKDPAFNGGSAITGYVFQLYTEGEAPRIVVPESISGQSAVIGGLQAGVSYGFGVAAVNKVGTGEEGRSSMTGKTFEVPGAPTLTGYDSMRAGDSYTLTLTWDAPEYDGGTPIIGYNILIDDIPQNGAVPVNTDTWVLTGQHVGERVRVKIEACNSVGKTASEEVTVIVGQLKAPEITELYTTVGAVSGTIEAKWTAVEGATDYIFVDVQTLYRNMGKEVPSNEVLAKMTSQELNALINSQVLPKNAVGNVVSNGGLAYSKSNRGIGTAYYIAVVAYNESIGFGMPTDVYEVTIGAPTAPVLESLTAGYESVTAVWSEPENGYGFDASYFELLCDGNPMGQIQSGVPFTLSKELFAVEAYGREHSFAVRAVRVNDGMTLNGLISNSKDGMPWTNPTTPELYRGEGEYSVGNSTFTIYFNKANGMGRDDIRYVVNWDGQDYFEDLVKITDEGSRMKAVVSGVTNGNKGDTGRGYPVYVVAYTGTGKTCGSAAPSEDEMLYIATGVPDAPEVTLTSYKDAHSRNVLHVAYKMPSQVSGFSLTQYGILVTDGNGTEWTEIIVSDPKTTSWDITQTPEGAALPNKARYTVKVRAFNMNGAGDYSPGRTITVGAPDAPKNAAAVAQQSGATVTWMKPDNDADVVKYTIYVRDSQGNEFAQDADRSAKLAVIRNLSNGETYQIQVTAWNENGESMRSNVCTVSPGTAPEAPVGLTAKATSDKTIELFWMPPEMDGGLAIRYYVVAGNGRQYMVYPDAENPDGQITYTFEGLSARTEYTFTVRAVNSIGNGEAAEVTMTTHAAPAKLSWVSVTSANSQLLARWLPTTDNGGSEVTHYKLKVYEYDNNDILRPILEKVITPDDCEVNVSRNYISYTFADEALRLGSDYMVTVSAKNESVEDYSVESDMQLVTLSGAVADTEPGAPTNIQASGGNGTINVSWTAPNYVGAGVDHYEVFYKPTGVSYYRTLEVRGATSAAITGLNNGTAYEIYVTAVNQKGSSTPSATVEATPMSIEAPGVPEIKYYLSALNSRYITVYWEAKENADSYHISVTDSAGDEVYSADVRDLYYGFAAVPQTSYNFSITAVNYGGASAANTVIVNSSLNLDMNTNGELDDEDYNIDRDMDGIADPVTQLKVPDAPTNLQARPEGLKRVVLTWMPPANNGGVEIVGYKLYIDDVKQEFVIPVSDENGNTQFVYESQDGSNVINTNQFMSFQMSAINSVGEGGKSNISQIFVPGSDAPVDLTFEEIPNIFGDYKLTWSAPTTASADLIGYRLQENGAEDEAQLIEATECIVHVKPETTTLYRVKAVYGSKDDLANAETSKATDAVSIYAEVPVPDVPVIESVEVVDALPEETVPDGELMVAVTWSDAATQVRADQYEVYVNGSLVERVTADLTANIQVSATDPSTIYVKAIVTRTSGGSSISKDASSIPMVYVPESGEDPSETAPVSVKDLKQDGEVTFDEETATVLLTWSQAEAVGDYGVSYNVYYAEYEGVVPEMLKLEDAAITDNADGTMSCPVDVAAGKDYIFYVTAVSIQNDEAVTDGESKPSNMVIVNARKQIVAPGVPVGVTASYDKKTGVVTIQWADSAGADGYNVYIDLFDTNGKQQMLDVLSEAVTISGTTCTVKLADVPGVNLEDKTSYAFQVTSYRSGEEADTILESAKSNPATIETNQTEDPEIPTAPSVPTDLRAVYIAAKEKVDENGDPVLDENNEPEWENAKFRLFWKAADDEGITHFGVKVGSNDERTFAVGDLKQNEAGEWYLDIDCVEYAIANAETYEVQVQCIKEVEVPAHGFLYSGPQEKVYKIATGVNEDIDGDDQPDKNVDNDGDGVTDSSVGVRLTGQVTIRGGDIGGVTFAIKQGEITLTEGKDYTVVIDTDGSFFLRVNVSANAGLYTVIASKTGCTNYTITDIALNGLSANEELKLGTLILCAGDVNGDGDIDFNDMAVAKLNYNKSGNIGMGDITGDAVIDFNDTAIISSNYNRKSISVAWKSN